MATAVLSCAHHTSSQSMSSAHTMSRIFKRLSSKSSKSHRQDAGAHATSSFDSQNPSQFTTISSSDSRSLSSTVESPPAYSLAPPSINRNSNADSPFAFLREFDTLFIIDDSGSMAGRSWRETAEALTAIAPICTQQDADGIDIYFLNHRNPHADDSLGGYENITSTSAVQEIFNSVHPCGGTATGSRLNKILRPYIDDVANAIKRPNQHKLPKPRNIIVITDGCASDDPESVIVHVAKKLDQLDAEPWQVGIQFFQVGHEVDAAKELRELDDALSGKHGIRDMVDTVPWNGVDGTTLTAEGIMKVTMGAVNRRLDRKQVSDARS